jgi:hypothetical protein
VVVIEGCKKTPKESFWQKVKAEFKKIERCADRPALTDWPVYQN